MSNILHLPLKAQWYEMIESITIGKGNPEWGAPDKEVFIIKLGKRI